MIDSELGEIPEEWRVSKIRDFGNITCGKTPPKSHRDYFLGNIPFIKIPDMHYQSFIIRTEDSLTEKGSNSQQNKFIQKHSICVSCIATVGLVSITTCVSQTNQQINSVIPFREAYLEYLYFFFKEIKDRLMALGRGGSATLNINTNIFSNINIIKPSDSILNEMHTVAGSLFCKTEHNLHQIQTLSSLRNRLLPKLMNGRVRIKKE